jgi:Ser/Thr protein kinase RdoA (MazF antagonist)
MSATLGLDTCLDAAAMRELLPAWLPGSPAIERVQIGKVRRSASRRRHPHPLTMVYELTLHDGSASRYYAKVFRDGASRQAPGAGNALAVPPLDMLLWPWPADPGLPQLAELLDARRALAWHDDAPAAVELLGWEPEQRAMLRYTQGANDLYAKTFCDERGARIHARFEHFWALALRDEHAPAVARPLAWHPRTRTVWQARAPGEPLAAVLGAPLPRALPGRLARAMATLHAARLQADAVHDTAHWLVEVRRRQRKISRALPALGGRVERVAEAIERAAALLPQPTTGLIHGDFHAGQVGVDPTGGGRIVFHDFDEFALGDPMEDLAAFVTRLPASGAAAEFGARLIAAYAQQAPERFGRRRLQWHLAVQMLLQAGRAFVFQVEGWRDELERRLARAEALCATGFQEALR